MIVVGLGIALAAAGLSYKWIKSKEAAAINPARQGKPVVVAGKDLEWGTVLDSHTVATTLLPEEGLPEGHFANPEQVKGRVLIASIKAKEPILESKLAPAGVTEAGLAITIKPGKRAMVMRAGDEGSFINENNRVDVLVTLRRSSEARTVLQNVPVLVAKDIASGRRSQGKLIVLEMSPYEAEKLVLASQEGTVRLALRNPQDRAFAPTRGIGLPEMLGLPAPQEIKIVEPPIVEEEEEPPPAPPSPVFELEIIRGGAISKAAFSIEGS